ncbi:MAG TPA: hypothetical protein VNY52_07555 [Solirubrobacteraceae bacterium]|jgi:hypothetical protein|nr:hypothetical protein [Solirubrobacteraceae bacterium]
MLRIRVPVLCAVLVVCSALVAAAVGAAPALASHNQTVFFEGGQELLEPRSREKAIAQMEHLGVGALRVELYWHDVAPSPNATKRPSFDATNPGAYNWGPYDWLLGKAKELNWPVLLTVTSPTPRWASANHTTVGSPNWKDFQEFMTAVGHHYGSQVALFAIWNEPNDAAFLLPQFNANGSPASPRIYRGLFQAGYAGLQAAGLAHPKVLMGETAPVGEDSLSRSYIRVAGLLHDVAPLAFLRGTLCLNSHYGKAGSCGSLPAYGYSHHAYTTRQGPLWHPVEPDDVTIGTLSRLEHALDASARSGAIRAGMPIYLTEFGVQSKPNRYYGVPAAKQAEWDALSEYIAWRDPRVAAFSQYLLRDDPVGGPPGSGVHGGRVGFQTGLEYVSGSFKPLYFGWPVPVVVSRQGHGFSLWGRARPATEATKVTILVRTRGARKYKVLKTQSTDSLGYWSFTSTVAGVSWRVRWTSPTGVKYEGPPIGAT